MIGCKVTHSKWGAGEVVALRHEGLEHQVRFTSGRVHWIRTEDLIPDGPIEKKLPIAPKEVAITSSSGKAFLARKSIEALRLGIVPQDQIDAFTFGRDDEISKMKDWLLYECDAVRIVLGEYGSGKSHFLNYVYWQALRLGYAVARVELDMNEVAFHRPKRMYARISRTLQYRSSRDSKLQSFNDFVRETLSLGGLQDHHYFRHMAGNTHRVSYWNWIQGVEATRPWEPGQFFIGNVPALHDAQKAANIYCYLISALGHAAQNYLGLRGLLVLVDEAETVDSSYGYQLQKGTNFLRALLRTASNDKKLLESPRKTDLEHSAQSDARDVPFLYTEPAGLKIVLAFTETSFVEQLKQYTSISLARIPGSALRDTLSLISSTYGDAYNVGIDKQQLEHIWKFALRKGRHMRSFVKSSVEAFDLLRWHGNLAHVLT